MNSNLAAISDDFGGLRFGVDADGNYGYKKAGADTVTPFKTAKPVKVYVCIWDGAGYLKCSIKVGIDSGDPITLYDGYVPGMILVGDIGLNANIVRDITI